MLEFYSYKRWLRISLAFHVSLILMIALSGLIQKIFSRPVFIAGGIGSAEPINVDVVGMPNVLKKDLASLGKEDVTEESKQEKKPEMTAPGDKKILEKKKDLISKLKDSVDQEQNYLKKVKIIKGLQVQKGVAGGTSTSSKGTGASSEALTTSPYFQTVKEHVRAYWKVPNWIKSDGLNTLVVLKIADDGTIYEISVSKSSNNPEFDQLALDSIRNAAPFPAPPIAVRDILNSGIVLSFP